MTNKHKALLNFMLGLFHMGLIYKKSQPLWEGNKELTIIGYIFFAVLTCLMILAFGLAGHYFFSKEEV